MSEFYSGEKLLSLQDLRGERPELYLVTSNRSAGKTTWFGRLLVNRFIKKGEKFMLLYRFNYELDDCADKFFKDIGGLFFPNREMRSERRASGIYHELYLNDESCGYAVSINSADQLKKYSHFFSDTASMLFDEFQSETNHYCSDEVKKFISIHTSVARGSGKQVRYVPVYMLSNTVTILNPYYVALGISSRVNKETRYLKGNGYVLEQGYVESAAHAQQQSAFNTAFASDSYIAYSSQNVYLNDNMSFVEKPEGQSRYLCTIRYKGKDYAVREYPSAGVVYCDDRPDSTYKWRITTTTEDHQINYVMLKRNDLFLSNMRYYFEKGCFRFKNLQCKEALMSTLSY